MESCMARVASQVDDRWRWSREGVSGLRAMHCCCMTYVSMPYSRPSWSTSLVPVKLPRCTKRTWHGKLRNLNTNLSRAHVWWHVVPKCQQTPLHWFYDPGAWARKNRCTRPPEWAGNQRSAELAFPLSQPENERPSTCSEFWTAKWGRAEQMVLLLLYWRLKETHRL